jgi:MarR-like DNA-binding transcriptional regulator SgrR of sgrS sRNA
MHRRLRQITRPVGTGPFTFDTWTPQLELRGRRFDGYWMADKPYLDEIVFDVREDGRFRSTPALASKYEEQLRLNQSRVDRLIAEGKGERIARAKAKAAWVRKQKQKLIDEGSA